jgi:uncharacterized membrane protein
MTSIRAKYRTFNRDLLGAIVLVLFAAQGALFSLLVTVMKFRIEQSCDGFLAMTCNSGCDITLSDPWSTLGGVPITMYATAIYMVELVLGVLAIARPRELLPAIRWPALALAWTLLLATGALALRSLWALQTWCHLCVILYLISVAVFAGTWALNPDGPARGVRRGPHRADRTTRLLTLAALAGLAIVFAAQYSRYWTAVADAGVERQGGSARLSCQDQRFQRLPDTQIRLASDGPPKVVVGLFVDLTCETCRQELALWRGLHPSHREFLQVDLLPFPMDAACGELRSNDSSRIHHACSGAIALQCMVEQAPDRAWEIVDAMFAVQAGADAAKFSAENVEEVRARLGLADLSACMQDIPYAVRHAVEFGLHTGLSGAPAVVVAPVCPAATEQQLQLLVGLKGEKVFEQAILDGRQKWSECNAQ